MAESPGGASQLAGHVVTIDSDDSSEAAPGNAAGKRLRVDASAGPLARAFARACPGGTLEGAAPSSHGGASQPSAEMPGSAPSGAAQPATPRPEDAQGSACEARERAAAAQLEAARTERKAQLISRAASLRMPVSRSTQRNVEKLRAQVCAELETRMKAAARSTRSACSGAAEPAAAGVAACAEPETRATAAGRNAGSGAAEPAATVAADASCGGGRREHRTTAKTRGLCSITMILAALQSLLASPIALLENAAVLHSLRRSGSG